MHLHGDFRARLKQAAGVGWLLPRRLTGDVGRNTGAIGVTAKQRATARCPGRNNAVQRMVQHGPIAGNVLACAHPAVLGNIDVHHRIVVVEYAGGRHFLWRYFNHVVWLAKRPFASRPAKLS